jgi:mannose-6-phosphate isomerase-like protein (cupin superfamily)
MRRSSVGRKAGTMPPRVVALTDELAGVTEHWSPRVVAALNGQYLKVAKLEGEFVWHDHAGEDELFLVLRGSLRLDFEDGSVTLGEGECCVVPRGVRHRPVAEAECWVALFEPAGTAHTVAVNDARTRSIADQTAHLED